jgi:ubiquinone/menaquinone biosynthesis C-methylase UbiE
MSLVGIDIDEYFVQAARTEAQMARVDDRVVFLKMDALKKLEFPDASFDLVNLRFRNGFLRLWDWPNLLKEAARVTRPQGVIRITEMEIARRSSSPALLQIGQMAVNAFFHSGHFSEPEPTGLTAHLEEFLLQQGYQQIQTKRIAPLIELKGETGRITHESLITHFMRLRSFVVKWSGSGAKEYDCLYQELLNDMQQNDFFYDQPYFIIWGMRGT